MTDDPGAATSAATAAVADRLTALAAQAAARGVDVILVGPGADLQYLAGHSVPSHERLTLLVVPADGAPAMLVPALERPGWNDSPIEVLGTPISTWLDGEDPYDAAVALFPTGTRVIAVDDHLPAVHALGIRDAVPGSDLTVAGAIIGELRMRKGSEEIAHLARVGAAIDRVQGRIGEWLLAGRTEREVAADIAAALIEEGHTRADFVIVASGPNGASPHHEASDRVIQPGDPVVIDIGGPESTGYFSDCTRTYQVAGTAPDGFAEVYEIVRRAQQAAVQVVRPGITAETVDRTARAIIAEAGYGDRFLTRTGHGIGLEVHEHPYMVEGNDRVLEPGMAFSVEPGIYLEGRFGIRIEDIVVVGEDGPVLMNRADRMLKVVG
ncbi:M24 family metallopeptidase [Nakamurella sp. YIM 132087]|uniref:M24 family metallopeptidase n=1 Tax=Nakamurella alba TaxID=2665158 RepID=A0A7K1FTU3_9ACTN|nr:Xaa-Pro peptidase family protein [Nakamurella alba]MTD16809.1 M24 family metallopeptidase [Nakamurella alba]